MSFPVTVVDNFFPDPEKIIEFSNTLKYIKDEYGGGRWPGIRCDNLATINNQQCYDFGQYVIRKVNNLFWQDEVETTAAALHFQKIKPFVKEKKDQFDPTNKGWIHKDYKQLAGLVYLSKDPQEDTGTSIYNFKNGIYNYYQEDLNYKRKLYSGKPFDKKEYLKAFERNQSYFYETINIKNVYNRLLLFNGQEFHAAQTFGYGEKERLTLNIFIDDHFPSTPPFAR